MRELTRILETEKVIAWILLNMWRLEPVTDTKVGINVPNKYNFKVISLQVLQLLSDLGKIKKVLQCSNPVEQDLETTLCVYGEINVGSQIYPKPD